MRLHDWLVKNGSAPALAALDLFYAAAFHAQRWLRPRRRRDVSAEPVRSFTAAVTNVCNARCTFCAYPKTKLDRGTMPAATFAAGLAAWKAAGGKAIDLTPTVGDPLIDRALESKIGAAADAGMRVSFTTNALLLAGRAKSILDAGLDELFVSLPSFDRLTYRMVYGVDGMQKAKDGIRAFLEANAARGEPCKVKLRFRNAERPSSIVRSVGFTYAVRPFLSPRVTVNFTAGFDNWGGTVRESDMHGTMRLKRRTVVNAPCEGLFGLSMRWDGKLRACACRFVESDEDDLIVGHIRQGLEPARQKAMEIADGFWSGRRPKTCQGCTLYHPAKL